MPYCAWSFSSCSRPALPSRGSHRPFRMSRSPKRSSSAAFWSMSLNPFVYHSFRYVDWSTALSTPAPKTSFSKSSTEYFWKCSMDQCVSAGPRPWYAWKHSIQPFAYSSAPGFQFAGLASQKCRWLSMTKYFSPSFSYMSSLLLDRLKVEPDVLRRVLRVREQRDPIVEDNHTPVVRGHDLLEVVVAEVVPAERLGDLLVVEVDAVGAVHADHRRQLGHPHAVLAAHDLGDDVADLVVHERDARHVRRRAVGDELGHAVTSLGASRPISPSRVSIRARERSKESSKRITLSDSCDQIGCIVRPAATALGT